MSDDELQGILHDEDGDYMLMPDPESAPDEWTRDALAAQNIAVITGRCPACGRGEQHDRGFDYREIQHVTVVHTAECPANGNNVHHHLHEHGLTLDNIGGFKYRLPEGDDLEPDGTI